MCEASKELEAQPDLMIFKNMTGCIPQDRGPLGFFNGKFDEKSRSNSHQMGEPEALARNQTCYTFIGR